MKSSDIRISVELNDQNIPEKIFWEAEDSPSGKLEEAKASLVCLWDAANKETLRLDLWTKDMPVDEMKRFSIDVLGGLADVIERATGDRMMAGEMHNLCAKFVQHLQNEAREQ